MDDIEIKIRETQGAQTENSLHPWWSRLLYLGYGVFAGIGATIAALSGETGAAFVAGGIAAGLIWKATQRRR